MIAAHGSRLINQILSDEERAMGQGEISELPTIKLDQFHLSELDNIACGLYSPLNGFMNKEAYRSVLESMRLPGGTVWPIPIVLPVEGSAS